MSKENDLFEYALRLGDDALVLGHRLSEWCAHAPELEEDLALANIALDCLGQANLLLTLAGELEGKGRTADDLAFMREAIDFRNVQLAELPTENDFARMIARQFLFDAFRLPLFQALAKSSHEKLAGCGAKAQKEVTYHLRHSRSWIIRLGDGTEESHKRIQAALEDIWPYVDELFWEDELELRLAEKNLIPRRSALKSTWDQTVADALREATLQVPSIPQRVHFGGGRAGRHTEYLGHMLAEMQIVARSFPGAKW